jgi:hypothetical protein
MKVQFKKYVHLKQSLALGLSMFLALPTGVFATNATAGQSSNERVLHLLNRISFGPKPGDIEAVKAVGVEKYLQQQMHPETIPEAASVSGFVNNSDALRMTPPELFENYGPPAERAEKTNTMSKIIVYDRRAKGRKNVQQRVIRDVDEAKILRAVESPRQLQEVMTDFV